MPYKEDGSDVPSYVKSGKEKQWAKIWNSVYKAAKDDKKSDADAESSAYAQATGVTNKPAHPKNRSEENTMKVEIRFVQELRTESQGDEMALVGYASLFNSESKDLGGFRETVAPGAFTRSLKDGADVHCLRNHDANCVLGRTKNKTLTLEQDERGLKFRCALDPNQQSHRDLHASVKRGDIDECSFAFTVGKDGQDWQEKKTDGGDWYAARTLKDVNLMDVSAVTYPAYGNTSVMARCFPDGMGAEIRSAVDTLTSRLDAEKRAADEVSYEAKADKLRAALAEKFPDADETGPSSMYWLSETYEDHIIAQNWKTDDYCSIPYHMGDDGSFMFGTPEPVKKEWVPTERCIKSAAAFRTAKDKFEKEHPAMPEPKKPESRSSMNKIIEQHKQDAAAAGALAAKHNQDKADHESAASAIEKACADRKKQMDEDGYEDGDWENDGDFEENQLIDPKDAWGIESEAERSALLVPETRGFADGKVLAKRVGGKLLTADRFAQVGDKNDTTTWKQPVHDESHCRKAVARKFDDATIVAKVKRAAKKFGVEATEPVPAPIGGARSAEQDATWKADIERRAKALMLIGTV